MKLSFVIPSYNCVTWLPHAVQSVMDQTHPDCELVIVNDGSTDRTIQYLEWLSKQITKFPVVIRNTVNRGRSESRNEGNRTATGDIILVLDADDLATPNRAALTFQKFKDKSIDYVYGSATVIDALGRTLNVVRADVFNKEKAISRLYNGIVHSTAAYRKSFALKYPHDSGEVARLGVDDWAQQIRAIHEGVKFDFIPQTIAVYRVLPSSISVTRDEEEVIRFKKEYLKQFGVASQAIEMMGVTP